MTKTELMKKIKEEILEDKNLPLFEYRKENRYFPVIGEGSHDSSILFIGEAPGENEAKTGKPFCGRAGKILDLLLEHVNLKREDVYITNIVKDRPPKNRDPLPNEIESYAPYLERQIKIIEPKVIATLGRHSMSHILKKFDLEDEIQTIGKMHGKIFESKNYINRVKIITLYHPAVAVYDQSKLDELKKDFEILKSVI